jgi:hypothetical protein
LRHLDNLDELTIDAEGKDQERNTLLYLDSHHLGCLMEKIWFTPSDYEKLKNFN